MAVSAVKNTAPLTENIIEMRQICKRFPGVQANDHIDFDVRKGEIHCLLGENGAGKTTLMKILYGMYRPDSGEIRIKGKKVDLKSPLDAIHLGIGMVHQHFTLVDSFTVSENIVLGTVEYKDMIKPSNLILNRHKINKEVEKLAKDFGFTVDPKARIWQLSASERQRVEILKALYRGIDILILDEPTSVLTPLEVEDFFKMLKSMNQKGLTVIFITHILDEAKAISDRITVFRDGKKKATLDTGTPTKKDLARLMVGRDVLFRIERDPPNFGDVVLEIKGLEAKSDRGLPALRGVNLTVRAGEIYGVAGVAGNGQSELAEVLTGSRKPVAGVVKVGGKKVGGKSPLKIMQQGVSCIPEDRRQVGVVLDFSLKENTILTRFYEPRFCKGLFVDWDAVEAYSKKIINDFDVKAKDIHTAARTLSGGNLQKFILARELSRKPKLIVAVHPTTGLDVGAIESVQTKLLQARKQGAAVLLISESLEEILNIADTIGVMYKGRIVKTFTSDKADVHEIALYMTGGKKEEA
ncbi:MAG: ABC transporter ATP-binding protein [Candidatus Ranarchaeia archaeon]